MLTHVCVKVDQREAGLAQVFCLEEFFPLFDNCLLFLGIGRLVERGLLSLCVGRGCLNSGSYGCVSCFFALQNINRTL